MFIPLQTDDEASSVDLKCHGGVKLIWIQVSQLHKCKKKKKKEEEGLP